MNRKERRLLQKKQRAAPTDGGTSMLLARGLRAHQSGNLTEAGRLYAQVLAADPLHAEAHHLLGVLAHQQGRPQEAVERIARALALDESLPYAHNNLGLALRQLGRVDDAAEHFARAVQLKPDYAEAHSNLGAALLARGQWDGAATHSRQAIELRPDFIPAHVNLGHALLALERTGEALAVARRALEMSDDAQARDLFLDCVTPVRFTADDGGYRRLMLRAMSEAWDRPGELARASASLIKLSEPVRTGVARATEAWPRRLPPQEVLTDAGWDALAQDSLLLCLLQSCPVADPPLERFLTNVRAAVLARALDASPEQPVAGAHLDLCGALACQCFINEYVFGTTDTEIGQARRLTEALDAALAAGAPVSPLWVAAAASYRSLDTLAAADRLADHDWPPAIAALLRQQIEEPARERHLRGTIPALTAADHAASHAVREQYEENPYPRWVKSRQPRHGLLSGAARLDGDILIAGCGTGQFTTELARAAPRARILAVDLSLASLAFARRMTEALGVTNLEFAQADILELPATGRTFDVIEAGGVLHHLADPAAGWRALSSMLRPGGVLRVALYSALARRDVAITRAYVVERGYRAEADDIRKCRTELMTFAAGTPQEAVTRWGDFASMSGCRDLLFHVREHGMTLPQIKAMLAETGLEFLGFDLPPQVPARFRREHADEAALLDLDRWAAFEAAHPYTFVDMYQFACRSPA